MATAGEEPKTVDEGLEQTTNAVRPARRGPRASRVAGGMAVAILLVMLVAYIFSMYGSGMDHSTSSDTTLHQDAVTTSVAAPVADDQMVMSDGEVMDMDEHSGAIPGTAVTEADHGSAAPAEVSHSEEMGGSVNWYVIGSRLASSLRGNRPNAQGLVSS